jgi:gamma-glutamylcyclotransferase (GGCT)/AIG2-like uncharacterized protein YtfP
MPDRIFVYGTLKRGFVNVQLMYAFGGQFIAEARTSEPCQLYVAGVLPYLQRSTEEEQPVHGEMWEIPEDYLVFIDQLEGHPHAYRREMIQTNLGPAWAYLWTRELRGEKVVCYTHPFIQCMNCEESQ